jgi:tetratricopeptide (TPR) repeat protein
VTTPAQREARAALDAARPTVARLDMTRGAEDLAADLVDVWRSVESALRSLVGSSALTGQALIREARQRQLINFDQANALAEFEAVNGRLQTTSYRPNDADVNSARNAFLRLDAALIDEPSYAAGYSAPRAAAAPPAATEPVADATVISTTSVRRRPAPWMWVLAAVVVIAVALGGYYTLGRSGSSSFNDGVRAYGAGQREVAVSAFSKAVREDPKAPAPHIYLARMAREVGNYSLAGQELQLALQADPNNPLALREMGANLLQQGNYELARRFYVRAVQADPTDKVSQGYLGCSLMRLGRVTEGTTFVNRAGPGPWTGCTPVAPATGTAANQAAGVIPR